MIPIAVQNFLVVFVLPIVSFSGAIYLFRWWLRRSTGYDPLGDKGQIHPKDANTSTRPETYAPYVPTKKHEDKAE